MHSMEVAIIGAGIAGIASSIRLAVAGHQVAVYEANDYPGGKLSEFTQDGYRFDAGPSLFTMPQFIEELFNLAGRDISKYFTYSKMENICHYFWNDRTKYTMPADRRLISQTLFDTFGEDKDSVVNYLATSQKKYDQTAPIFLEKSLHKLSTYRSKEMIPALTSIPSLGLFKSLHEVNAETFSNAKTVQLFDRFATYNGSSPYQTPGIMSMIPHLEMGIGTFFPHKGMVSITDCLVTLAKELGVSFQMNSKVEEILYESGKATGIKVHGEEITSDLVVSNMDVFATYHHLLPRAQKPRRILEQERSSSALIFYWGIKKSFNQLGLHNIFFADDYEGEFMTIFEQKTIAGDPTVYLHISSKCKSDDAPNGCENWFTMINTPGDYGQDWNNLIAKAKSHIIRKLSNLLEEPIEPLIVTEGILDPRLIQSKTQSHRGALYGTASNNRYAAFLRHANFSKEIKNLYFCGGSVHPGGGIPLCLQSAKIVTNIISKEHPAS